MGGRRDIVLALACVIWLVAPAPVAPAQDETPWAGELRAQIAGKTGCEIKFLTNIREKGAEGARQLTGRAHCTDGRSFDFERTEPSWDFTFSSCAVESC